jgi:hypothetical protein
VLLMSWSWVPRVTSSPSAASSEPWWRAWQTRGLTPGRVGTALLPALRAGQRPLTAALRR